MTMRNMNITMKSRPILLLRVYKNKNLAFFTASCIVQTLHLSDRKLTIMAAVIAKVNGENVDDGPLSCSAVCYKCSLQHSAIASTVLREFCMTEKQPLIVHCDG